MDRLGNFIKQIRNAIQVALFYNYNIIIPYHKYFNTRYIVLNPDVTFEHPCITDKGEFFKTRLIQNIDMELFLQNKEQTRNVLRNVFTLRNTKPLGSNDVLIHIRSGDVFSKHTHPAYIMPPLSYFVDILNKNSFREIYLVAEDTRNPCIPKLIELYPQIHFQVQSLEEDIDLILGASNVVTTYGTFVPSLLMISEHVTNIFTPSYAVSEFNLLDGNPAVHIHSTDLTEYREQQFPFRNTASQIQRMLTYTPSP